VIPSNPLSKLQFRDSGSHVKGFLVEANRSLVATGEMHDSFQTRPPELFLASEAG